MSKRFCGPLSSLSEWSHLLPVDKVQKKKCSDSTQTLKINTDELTFCLTVPIVLWFSLAFSLITAVAFLVDICSWTCTSFSSICCTSSVVTLCSLLFSFEEGGPLTVSDPFCTDVVCHNIVSTYLWLHILHCINKTAFMFSSRNTFLTCSSSRP